MLRWVRALGVMALGAALAAACGLDTSGGGVTPGDGGISDSGGFDGVTGQCFAGAKVCDGKCIPNEDPQTGCGGTACEPCNLANATAKCTGGTCDVDSCNPGFADCSGGSWDGCETDLATNPLNCGACKNDCTVKGPTWIVCKAGECKQSNCPLGEGDCDLDEICETNLNTDVNNCKLCGIQCTFPNAAAACEGGSCVMKDCDPGWADCNNDPKDGCEVNTKTDIGHCGQCGTICQPFHAAAACVDGSCVPACEANWGNCDGDPNDGCETPTNTVNNCGKCGTKCTAAPSGGTAACIAGKCDFNCGPGLTKCGNACVDTKTDVNNCNTCGTKCTTAVANATAACVSSACTFTCNGSLAKCGNACVNTTNDVNNCNGCGTKCTTAVANATAACVSSACTFTCNGSLTKCGNACVNTTNDANNCNNCGTKCTTAVPNATATCASSACTFTCNGSLTKCGNACVNTLTDVNHCGSCPNVCPDPNPGNPTCDAGVCGINCGSLTNCSGACVNTQTNPDHCGSCPKVCAQQNVVTRTCALGICDYTSCQGGHADCDSDRTNGCETPLGTNSDCSSCGDDCKGGKTCQNGSCD